MSPTLFIEALSSDPYVRDLHRRALRLLNDPSLDRAQREFHIRQVQELLRTHQTKVQQVARPANTRKGGGSQGSVLHNKEAMADKSQVLARRREFDQVVAPACASQTLMPEPRVETANTDTRTRTGRPVLTLKRT